jgi:transposase
LTAGIVAELAGQVLELDQRIDDLDEVLTAQLRQHSQAKVLTSLPSIGLLLAAESRWPSGPGQLASANHLAAYAGLAPAPWIRAAAAAGYADPSAITASCCGSSTSLR